MMNSKITAKFSFPPSIDWWITSKCNLKCSFCFGPIRCYSQSSKIRCLIAENICLSGSGYVTLCGGEPLLVPELLNILELFTRHNKNIILNTNGELLSKSRFVYKYINTIGIPIDGYDDVTHRQMRSEKANLQNCIDEIWHIKNNCSIKLKIGTVLSKVNLPYIFNIAKIVKDVAPDVWRIYQFSPRGKANKSVKKHNLSLCDFETMVDRLLSRYPAINISTSSLIDTEGCFIIDECGFFIKPRGNDYIRYSSCLNERIDDVWKKYNDSSVNILQNKFWINENQ